VHVLIERDPRSIQRVDRAPGVHVRIEGSRLLPRRLHDSVEEPSAERAGCISGSQCSPDGEDLRASSSCGQHVERALRPETLEEFGCEPWVRQIGLDLSQPLSDTLPVSVGEQAPQLLDGAVGGARCVRLARKPKARAPGTVASLGRDDLVDPASEIATPIRRPARHLVDCGRCRGRDPGLGEKAGDRPRVLIQRTRCVVQMPSQFPGAVGIQSSECHAWPSPIGLFKH
jgi:hypothetical protein